MWVHATWAGPRRRGAGGRAPLDNTGWHQREAPPLGVQARRQQRRLGRCGVAMACREPMARPLRAACSSDSGGTPGQQGPVLLRTRSHAWLLPHSPLPWPRLL